MFDYNIITSLLITLADLTKIYKKLHKRLPSGI